MNNPGFLGTQASFIKDITLVLEVLFYLALCAGVTAQLRGLYKWHDRFQIPVVLLNIGLIVFVMAPSFMGVTGSVPAQLSQVPVAVPFIHGILGTIAQGLAIYCLLAGLKILPRKIGVLRYWMWAAFIAWTATVFFGVTTYIVYYALPAQSDSTIQEHAASVPDHDSENIAVATEVPLATVVVAEHAEEITEEVKATEVPATPVTITDHAADVAEATEVPLTTPITPTDQATVIPVVVESEFTGEMAKATWEQLQPTNAGPGARYEHGLQYHHATKQLYLFGGRDKQTLFNDVWVLDLASLTWRELGVNSPTKPAPRYSMITMVDNAGTYLYVTTGDGENGQLFNDLWRFNLKTEVWEDLTTTAGTTYQARYGNGTPNGNLNDTLIVTHGFGGERYDDTWQYIPQVGTWENITPTSDKPLGRCLFAATPSEGNYVIHGGCGTPNGPCFLDDTWVFNMQTKAWQQVMSEVKPVGRQHHTLVAGATGSNRVILFGGQDASQTARNDLWYLDVPSGTWQKVDAPNGPEVRYNHASVWVPVQKAMLVYGGRNEAGGLGDLWQLNLQPK